MDNKELGEYVEKLQKGDRGAFNVIYEETSKTVNGLLRSYTKNQDESNDLMQETYITVSEKIGTLKDKESLRSWINRIAINKANRYFEKSKREVLLSEEGQGIFEAQLEKDEEFLPQEILDSMEKRRIIKDIIDNLPLEQKTAIYLYYFDELSLAEVAEEMQCSEGTVKSRLNYARKKIKDEVDTWEKKGTKLYSTGIPVLLLLLRRELADINMPEEQSKKVLEEIMKQISIDNPVSNYSNTDVRNNNADNITNNLNNGIGESAKTAGKAIGMKAGIAGLIIVGALGSGAFIYNNVNSNSVSQKEITLTMEELKNKDEAYSKVNGCNFDIEQLYSKSLKLYSISKENKYDNMELDKIIDGINNMGIFDVYNLYWADGIIDNSTDNMKNIMKHEEEISKLKKSKKLTDEEKEMVDLSNQMIVYFVKNQENIVKLKGAVEKVSEWKVDDSDKTFKEIKESIKKDATDKLNNYKVYEDKLNELKKFIGK